MYEGNFAFQAHSTVPTSRPDEHDGELDDLEHGDEQRLRDGVLLGLAEVPHAVVAHLL